MFWEDPVGDKVCNTFVRGMKDVAKIRDRRVMNYFRWVKTINYIGNRC